MSNCPNAFRASVFCFPAAKKQPHWYLVPPIPAGTLLAASSEVTKTSCCSVTKKTNLKRLPVLVPCIAESICSWASPKACAIMRCRKRWRLEAQGSASHPFCRPVVVRLRFPVPLLLRVIYYKEVLTGLLTFLLFSLPIQPISTLNHLSKTYNSLVLSFKNP